MWVWLNWFMLSDKACEDTNTPSLGTGRGKSWEQMAFEVFYAVVAWLTWSLKSMVESQRLWPGNCSGSSRSWRQGKCWARKEKEKKKGKMKNENEKRNLAINADTARFELMDSSNPLTSDSLVLGFGHVSLYPEDYIHIDLYFHKLSLEASSSKLW